jgi:hypothetical protein
MPRPLTIPLLRKEAVAFAKAESTYGEPSLFGVTDGKAVGTYLEHKFQSLLNPIPVEPLVSFGNITPKVTLRSAVVFH